MQLILIALGGAIGASLRFLLSILINKIDGFRIFSTTILPYDFPLAILCINILGCFFIGIFMQFLQNELLLKSFLVVGILGGFTTFSSFSYDFLLLWQKEEFLKAFLYFFATNFFGLLAVFAGMSISKICLNLAH